MTEHQLAGCATRDFAPHSTAKTRSVGSMRLPSRQ